MGKLIFDIETGELKEVVENPRWLEKREGNWVEFTDMDMLRKKPSLNVCSNHRKYQRITRYVWLSEIGEHIIQGTYRRNRVEGNTIQDNKGTV